MLLINYCKIVFKSDLWIGASPNLMKGSFNSTHYWFKHKLRLGKWSNKTESAHSANLYFTKSSNINRRRITQLRLKSSDAQIPHIKYVKPDTYILDASWYIQIFIQTLVLNAYAHNSHIKHVKPNTHWTTPNTSKSLSRLMCRKHVRLAY